MSSSIEPMVTQNMIRDCGRFVRVAWAANRMYCRTYQRLEVVNPCPIPESGPSILVCNHISGLDPLLLQSACSRIVIWMMAKEFYEVPALHPSFRRIDAIPVNRGARDANSLRLALRALHGGRLLGVFPEGRIAVGSEAGLLDFRPGVASLALRTGATIYPAYINGTNRGKDVFPSLKYSNTVRIRFGSPLRVEIARGGETMQTRLNVVVRNAVEELRQAELREFGRILGVVSL